MTLDVLAYTSPAIGAARTTTPVVYLCYRKKPQFMHCGSCYFDFFAFLGLGGAVTRTPSAFSTSYGTIFALFSAPSQ